MAKKENRLVVGSEQWAKSLPDWLLDEIRKERMLLGLIAVANPSMKDSKKIGDAEVAAYLFTASLRAPLPHNLAEIHLYLTTKLMEERGQTIPGDIRRTELDRDCQRELQKLKSMIYDKRGGDIQHPVLDMVRQLAKECKTKKLPHLERALFNGAEE